MSETELADEELAAIAARRGESDRASAQDAFQRLYRRYAPLLLAFLAARVRPSDREDLHQEVWQRVWAHLPQHLDPGKFRGWLYEIARNAVIDHGRKRKAESLADPEAIPDGRASREADPLIAQERMNVLSRCMEKLNPRTAAVVRARLAGEDYPELCQRLKITIKQAYKDLNSAKKQLETCVERALR